MTSLFAGSLLAGLGLLATWGWEQVYGRGYVRDEEIAIALVAASGVWVAVLFWIWGRVRRAGVLVRPILLTIGIGIAASLAGLMIDVFVRRDDETVIGAMFLIFGAFALLAWLPAIVRLQRGKPVIDADNQVDVHCPNCGYSLIGLRDLRCPECGTRFTIDELIRAQDYSLPDRCQDMPDLAASSSGVLGRVGSADSASRASPRGKDSSSPARIESR